MHPARPSRTALAAAMYRAAHQDLDDGRLFTDPFACKILGSDELRKRAVERGEAQPLMRIYIAVRSAFAERKLAAAVARADDDDGARQIVVLGAGLDTLLLRNPFSPLPLFEVDHPATQAWKRELLQNAGLVAAENARFVAVDFERDALDVELVRAGFRVDVPAFFVWLGVVPYLTDAAVFQTIDVLRSFRASEVVFDYTNPIDQLDDAARAATEERAAKVAALGEPFLCAFDTASLHARLHALGATSLDDLGPARIAALLGRTTSTDAGGHVVDVRFRSRH